MLQQDEKDCGATCLAMILAHYHTKIPIQKIRELSGTDLQGVSAFGLKKCMELLNFECKAIKADNNIWHEQELPFPLIAHVVVDNAYLHYVVVYSVKGDILKIADPDKGKIQKKITDFSNEWSGVLLLMTPKDEYQPSKEKTSGINSFLPILWKQKGLIFNIVLSSVFITIFGIMSSYYFQGIIDFFIPNKATSTLNVVSIGLILIYIFKALFEFVHNYLLSILGQRMSMSIMLGYIKHVFALPMNFFATRKSGEIISRFLDANKIIDALASATLSVFLDGGIVFIIGGTLAIQNITLFFITLASLPFYAISILAFVKIFDKANEQEMSAGATLNSSIIESLKGIETIKAYNGESKVYNRIDHEFVILMKKSFKTTIFDYTQQGLKNVIQLISSALILWVGSYFVMNGAISTGQLIAYNALLVFFTDPLQNIINLQVKMQAAQVANKRLNEIFTVEQEKTGTVEHGKFGAEIFSKPIFIKNVSFSYRMKAPTLKKINISIPERSKITVVGVSGSGKSTLAKLLVNFYLPTEGSILYGNMNSQDMDSKFLRNHVTYVPQDSFFFSGTFLENLVFGVEEAPPF